MSKSCLLFDNDGTLVDSEYLCNLGIAHAFLELDVTLDADDLVKHYRGMKLSEIMASISRQYSVELPDDFISSYRKRVASLFDKHLTPIEGVVYALDHLHHRKAVVSNGPRQKIEHALNVCQLRGYFNDNIFSAYDIGYYKPNPQIYLDVAAMMKVSPNQCVVIEDSKVGAEAGSRAGITTLFYNRYNETLSLPHVTSFNDMKQLPKMIANVS
ncbi:HAD-IA family hydrolase [Alteromonas australica]|uniref:Haloacid dehalogenase n=1 Tax=Alteromonas australica TaxID=589873 RepID=A0A075P8S7_9ALTE|nr:HAD-IA family hydrolase [Alteromonas australica]AIF99737.1 haloacid dehalogenase [Alteromonas australica]